MTLSKNSLLQVNTTVIAGLLILLTIQSTASFSDYLDNGQVIENKISALNETAKTTKDVILSEKIHQRISELRISEIELLQESKFENFIAISPSVFFLVSMMAFIGSCIWEMKDSTANSISNMTNKNHNSTTTGKVFSYLGFSLLFTSVFYLLAIQIASPIV